MGRQAREASWTDIPLRHTRRPTSSTETPPSSKYFYNSHKETNKTRSPIQQFNLVLTIAHHDRITHHPSFSTKLRRLGFQQSHGLGFAPSTVHNRRLHGLLDAWLPPRHLLEPCWRRLSGFYAAPPLGSAFLQGPHNLDTGEI